MSESKFKIGETVKFNGERMKIIGIRSVNWGAKYVYELLRDQDGNVDHDWNIKEDEIEKLEWDLKKVPEDNRSEFLKNLSSKDDATTIYEKYIEQKQLVEKLLKANHEVVEENGKLKRDLGQAKSDADYYANQARDKSKILNDVLKSNEEISKGYEELSEKYNELEEKVHEYDGIRSDNAHMVSRNADLEERVKRAIEIGKNEREEKVMYKAAWEETKRELNNMKFAVKQEDHYYDILKTFLNH